MKQVFALLILCMSAVHVEDVAAWNQARNMKMNGQVIFLNDGDFDRTIQNSNVPVVLDIQASWCGAYKALSPVIDALNAQYASRVLFAKIDTDASPSFVQRYDVSGLPTILFFRPGNMNPVHKHTGYFAKPEFEAKINETLL